MDAFLWNHCFTTGLLDVDAQHHKLVEVINRFGDLVIQQETAKPEQLQAIFDELAAYARYHFDSEESLMEAAPLDPGYIAQHRAVHNSFMEEVASLRRRMQTEQQHLGHKLLEFLSHWLAYHILGDDQLMARQIVAVKAGTPPNQAWRTQRNQTGDAATDALLSALNSLFLQVSERNRELARVNASLEERVFLRTQELHAANLRLDDLANTDLLTGLPNRRQAMSTFTCEWEYATQTHTPLACMMIDADGFKGVNDNYGHDAGDTVLKALATRLKHSVRNDDVVYRLGGDEFLILCTNTPRTGALQLAEKVRAEVNRLIVPTGDGQWQGSISIGVALRTADMRTPEDLMKKADEGLYLAKAKGRNRVASTQTT